MERKDEQAGEAAVELRLPAALQVLSGIGSTAALSAPSGSGFCLRRCQCFRAFVLLLHPAHISLCACSDEITL